MELVFLDVVSYVTVGRLSTGLEIAELLTRRFNHVGRQAHSSGEAILEGLPGLAGSRLAGKASANRAVLRLTRSGSG